MTFAVAHEREVYESSSRSRKRVSQTDLVLRCVMGLRAMPVRQSEEGVDLPDSASDRRRWRNTTGVPSAGISRAGLPPARVPSRVMNHRNSKCHPNVAARDESFNSSRLASGPKWAPSAR